MNIVYGAGGIPMVKQPEEKKVEPVMETAKTEIKKQDVLQEILVENPNEEEDEDDGFDEAHGDDGC